MNERPRQLDYIDKARQATMAWAKAHNIQLFKLEFVVPFVVTDKSLSVWLFFDSNHLVREYENTGVTERVKNELIQSLKELSYPADYLGEIAFFVDSHENVTLNFGGSYFYRLR